MLSRGFFISLFIEEVIEESPKLERNKDIKRGG